jgi:hypothetical protein
MRRTSSETLAVTPEIRLRFQTIRRQQGDSLPDDLLGTVKLVKTSNDDSSLERQ